MTEEEVRELFQMEAALERVKASFRAQHAGRALNRSREHIILPHLSLHYMAAALPEENLPGMKIYTVARNAFRFVVLLFDAESGDLVAMLEADHLGRMRTGAASGVATKFMTRLDATRVGLMGTGRQARFGAGPPPMKSLCSSRAASPCGTWRLRAPSIAGRSRTEREENSGSGGTDRGAKLMNRPAARRIFIKQMRLSGVLLPVVLLVSCAASPGPKSAETPAKFDDAPFERVLSTYVNAAGKVNYAALKQNRGNLDRMVGEIEQASPENAPQLFPNRNAQLAYWINAYNAWILRIVVDHYPLSSITKTDRIPFGAFSIQRVTLGGKKMTLRSLENDILRSRFHDPRIHFAINCASLSCPPLAPHVYRAETLDRQLDEAAQAFINDNRNVTLDEAHHKIVLSKIFDWYDADFKDYLAAHGHQGATVVDYLKLYAAPARRRTLDQMAGAQISFYDYDWGLNNQARGSSPGS